MSAFTGFSEDYIKSVQNNTEDGKRTEMDKTNKTINLTKKSNANTKIHSKDHKFMNKSKDELNIPPEARLYKEISSKIVNTVNTPQEMPLANCLNENEVINATMDKQYEEQQKHEEGKKHEELKKHETLKGHEDLMSHKEQRVHETLNDHEEHKEQQLQENSLNNGVIVNKQKFKDLEEFQARQKLIEEQNRKRKELLTKTLEDKCKRTQKEAAKLVEIRNEFKKLDAVLSNDVKILRHQIELASIDYLEAQKRYHKIEKEFLDAKLSLHQKLEKKEMLTEHLCTIIERNEERKAEKLTDLLRKLEIMDDESSEASNGEGCAKS